MVSRDSKKHEFQIYQDTVPRVYANTLLRKGGDGQDLLESRLYMAGKENVTLTLSTTHPQRNWHVDQVKSPVYSFFKESNSFLCGASPGSRGGRTCPVHGTRSTVATHVVKHSNVVKSFRMCCVVAITTREWQPTQQKLMKWWKM